VGGSVSTLDRGNAFLDFLWPPSHSFLSDVIGNVLPHQPLSPTDGINRPSEEFFLLGFTTTLDPHLLVIVHIATLVRIHINKARTTSDDGRDNVEKCGLNHTFLRGSPSQAPSSV